MNRREKIIGSHFFNFIKNIQSAAVCTKPCSLKSMIKQLMNQKSKWALHFFLLLLVLYALHIIDNLTLQHLYKPIHRRSFDVYENFRFIVHVALWVIVLIGGILTLIDFVNKQQLIKSRQSQSFLCFLIISVCTELPIYSCYAGVFEPFWKSFHLH
jgi:hypothetical protein